MSDGRRLRDRLDGWARRQWRAYRYRRVPGWLSALVPRARVEAETIAVLLGALNRSGERVERLFQTLRGQRLPERCLDITVCDLGSTAEHLADLTERCRRHRVRLVALRQVDPVWCRARAINVAARRAAASARWLFPTDLDMLFAPDFFETVLRTHLSARGRALVITDALDLPPDDQWSALDPVADFARLVALGTYRDCLGSGACQSTTRAWFEQVRGYDERLLGWGYEDDDLRRRARQDGLLPISVQYRTYMLHQWHETDRERMAREGRLAEFEAQYQRNIDTGGADDSVVRNPDGWGELTEQAEILEP